MGVVVAIAIPAIVVLIGAWSYRWVQEDAFIDFRIIGNLLAGHGPVYNIGERVEVYSDPLWLYLEAAIHEVIPFASLEWTAVVLGMAGTVTGVVLSGRAVQRLGESRGEGLVVPIGMMIFSVVAGVWEFATSGLEMGFVFFWIGLSFWLLVRTEQRRRGAGLPAFVMGLGTLIRPELGLMTVAFLVTLGVIVASPSWEDPAAVRWREAKMLLAALALPVAYELFRMAYFALLVSNTALAKSATSTWWTQGFTYVWNFVAPYTLWLPLGLVAIVMAPMLVRWWGNDRLGVAVALTPLAAGVLDVLYVAGVGGDYMHARLALPGFCAICTSLFFRAPSLRSTRPVLLVLIGVILVWAVACVGWLRFSGSEKAAQRIGDERRIWIGASGVGHPIEPSDFRATLPFRAGVYYRTLADRVPHGQQRVFVETGILFFSHGTLLPARSHLPFALATNIPGIGIAGIESGPNVYIFDGASLANPIGSHLTTRAGRIGRDIDVDWMVGRFGIPGHQTVKKGPAVKRGPTIESDNAARAALSCLPLSAYIKSITASLTFSSAGLDIFHSITNTSMMFSANPVRAQVQLCE